MKTGVLSGLLLFTISFQSFTQNIEPGILSEAFNSRPMYSSSDGFTKLKHIINQAVAEAEVTRRISPLEIGAGIALPFVYGFFLYPQSRIQGKFMMISGVGATGLTILLNELLWLRLKKADRLIDDDFDQTGSGNLMKVDW
jgi:hypothetical protein